MARGLGLVLYGPPGIGKTHFSAFFPKPLLFISLHETGFDDLKIYPGVPEGITDLNLTDFNQLMDALGQCAKNPHFKTVVIDSMSGFQQVFFDFLIRSDIPQTKTGSYKEAETLFWAWSKGPNKQAPNCMPPFTSLLSSLLGQGTNVILIGHKIKDEEFNEAGADYARAVIDMNKGIRQCIVKWAPNIIYMSMQPNATQVTQSSGYGNSATPTHVKTDGVGTKLIYTQTNPQNDAKNKLGLPYYIPIGDSAESTFKTFWSLLPEAFKQ